MLLLCYLLIHVIHLSNRHKKRGRKNTPPYTLLLLKYIEIW